MTKLLREWVKDFSFWIATTAIAAAVGWGINMDMRQRALENQVQRIETAMLTKEDVKDVVSAIKFPWDADRSMFLSKVSGLEDEVTENRKEIDSNREKVLLVVANNTQAIIKLSTQMEFLVDQFKQANLGEVSPKDVLKAVQELKESQ